eukprot:jgi/Psemu1/23295/gm1.23295_g
MTVYDITQHRYGKSNTREATTVANQTADSSRACFATLLQGKYTKLKAAPPDTLILVPIKPVKSTADTNLPIPSPCTGIPPVKTIESKVELTIQVAVQCTSKSPNSTTSFKSVPIPRAGASPVTANLGPLQSVGPIAYTPSIKAPGYIWTWTYSPNSESFSFCRVRSGSISFQRATSLSPPVQRWDKSPPCEPTNF